MKSSPELRRARRAMTAFDLATSRWDDAVLDARKAGHSIYEIADAVSLSHVAVWKNLKRLSPGIEKAKKNRGET
jgi:hypothetical protein